MQNFSTLLLIAIMFFMSSCSRPESPLQHTLPERCSVYDMKQAACISEQELVRRMGPYRVIFMGDYHASDAMHARFANVLVSLGKSGRHVMLANEWFTPQDDVLLSQYAKGTFDGNFTKAIDWEKKAGYPFSSYAPIYLGVNSIDGMLYGINMDKAFQKALSDNNITGMSEQQRAFYDALDMNLSAHRALLTPFFSHCHAKKSGENEQECFERMYRVQVAWDSYMGQQSAVLAQDLLKSRSDLLVVFAGTMHMEYGIGINARFARHSREPFVTILPVPSGTQSAEIGEADYLLFFTPHTTGKEKP